MKKYIFLPGLVFTVILSLNGFSQKKVIDIAELPGLWTQFVQPDVMGKVLISGELYESLNSYDNIETIELWLNWPVQMTGDSQRGGIYCNLDSDPELEIIYNVSQMVYAWNIDGSAVPGWPVSVQLYPDGAPAFGDIDGDSEGEVVVSTRSAGTGNTGKLFAFNKDGSPVEGFPINLGGGATKSPVLADLNGDDVLEIIIEERDYPDGYVGVYNGDGTSYPGFPVQLDYIPASAVAVGDINGDDFPEIVAESYYSVFAFDNEGNLLEGFPYTPGNDRVFSYSAPVLADLDGDGNREILVGDHSLSVGNGAVHIIKNNGVPFPGWPKYTGNWIYSPPAVADINQDGNLDIAVGDQVLSGTPADKVYVWDKNGNNLPGWPTSNINAINNQIIVADLDGDNMIELMWDDNTNAGVYIGYNHNGTPMDDWPLMVTGSSFFMNPFVTDINGDGVLDISGASKDLSTSAIYFYLWNANVPFNADLAILPVLQYNVQHDGVYRDISILNADFIAAPLEFCEGGQVQFTDQSTGNVNSWEWIFEGGSPSLSSEQNPLILYAASGTYDVTLTVSDGNNSDNVVKANYITADDNPVAPDQPVGPTEVITSQTLFTYYETQSPNADDYTWLLTPEDVGVLLPGDTITEIKIYWSQANNYMAQLKVKSSNACGESEFSEDLTIYVNWNTDVSSQTKKDPYKIYPNPGDGNFCIDFAPGKGTYNCSLINNMGILINKNYIDISDKQSIFFKNKNLETGLYFLIIETDAKKWFEKIIIVK